MESFATLLSEIEQTNSTREKVRVMVTFFKSVDPETAVWALFFLSGQRPKKFISSKTLRSWAEELAGLPSWLAEECYAAVGDTAEMIALVLAPFKHQGLKKRDQASLSKWIQERFRSIENATEETQKQVVQSWWTELSTRETFVLNKLMTGGLRIGVSETLVYRALSEAYEIPKSTVAARLLGKWSPSVEFFSRVIRPPSEDEAQALSSSDETSLSAVPVPFCLAAPLEGEASALGRIQDWILEWKWDGIRAQVVKVGAESSKPHIEIWSRGEERVTESFPDLVSLFLKFPGNFTLDGEILAGIANDPDTFPGTFNDLQKRLNRKKVSAHLLKESPVSFLAYDLIKVQEGSHLKDITNESLMKRRELLNQNFNPLCNEQFSISHEIQASDWQEAATLQSQSRTHHAEGLMIKKKSAPYQTGRKRGVWYKWKINPLTLDTVLIAAQPGTGRRASLYTDYTFGIWKEESLVPIAKAYSGLTDSEIHELDQWIRKNTVGRFGPVRTLKPERVFEIGFEGVAESSRHKSGYSLRFPRILRERTDKPASDADRVETVQALLKSLSHPSPSKENSENDLQVKMEWQK